MQADYQSSALREGQVSINPTLWGYVIHSRCVAPRATGVAAVLRMIIGGVSAVMVFGLIFWSGVEPGFEVLAMKLGAVLFFAFLALVMLYRRPVKAVREVQVDMNRGEIFTGYRTPQGAFVLDLQARFEEISTVLLVKEGAGQGQLLLRPGSEAFAIPLANGSFDPLDDLSRRLARDLGAILAGFNPATNSQPAVSSPLLLGPRLEVQRAA